MKNLEAYVEQKNAWNKIFSIKAINFPLSQANANELMNMIGSELSPENLHCDGEISRTQAQNKYNYYGRVIKELDRYCAGQGLKMPVVEEYY